MQISEKLRAEIKRIREAEGLSQKQLADRAGTNQQTIDRIERGDVRFSRAGSAILHALGMASPHDLTTRGGRLRWARIQAGYASASAAAEALGMKVGTYNSHERAEETGRDYGADEADRYARRFKVSPVWLLYGRGDAEQRPSGGADLLPEPVSNSHSLPARANLRALRTARGWTHEMAAQAMGISRASFIKLERGERKLSERTIALAAEAFGVTIAELFPSSNPPAPAAVSQVAQDDDLITLAEREARRLASENDCGAAIIMRMLIERLQRTLPAARGNGAGVTKRSE